MSHSPRLRAAACVAAAASLALSGATLASAEPSATPSATPATPSTPASAPNTAATAIPSAATPPESASSAPAQAPSATTSESAPASAATALAPSATAASTVPTTDAACTTTKPLTLFTINDFHGRIEAAPALFTQVENRRAEISPNNVALLSAGDNIGASTFVSMVGDDMPTINVLNDAGLESSAVGNHEFDGGWAKLRDKYMPAAQWQYLASNMTGTTLKPYTVIVKDGVRIAVIGAEVGELSTLVSPAGIQGITVSPEVAAVNQTADGIKARGEADVIVAEIHNELTSGYSKNVDVIFNGHTHQAYNETTELGQPVLQTGSYGTKIGRVDLNIGAGNVICGPAAASLVDPAAKDKIATTPAIQKMQADIAQAKAAADQIGQQIVGKSCGKITRGSKPGDTASKPGDDRGVESTMTDMVAQSFYDRLGNGDPNFIGMQNPGGSRDDLPAGDVSYQQAAAVLPFANTLMTTRITGAQLKTVLEQQWQRDDKGAVPTRAYLQLGLSKNVSYTYDESRPEGDRITSIIVNGKPYDPAATYTVGSGSFLIAGGDNFRELAKGQGAADTGKSDLAEWVGWIKDTTAKNGEVCGNTARRAVAVALPESKTVSCTATTTFTVGQPASGGVAADTLNFSNGVAEETTIKASVNGQQIGEFPVAAGVAQVAVQAPADGKGGQLVLTTGNGTTVDLGSAGVTVEACASDATPEPTPVPEPTPTTEPSVEPTVPGRDIPNCQALGRTDVPASDPQYRPWLDADNDGIACEWGSPELTDPAPGMGTTPGLANTGGDAVAPLVVLSVAAALAGATVLRRR